MLNFKGCSHLPNMMQDPSGVWNPQADKTQWGNTCYGYGQGYGAYAYGATQDTSLYAYVAYGGYMQYPQQVKVVRILDQWQVLHHLWNKGRKYMTLWPHQMLTKPNVPIPSSSPNNWFTIGRN